VEQEIKNAKLRKARKSYNPETTASNSRDKVMRKSRKIYLTVSSWLFGIGSVSLVFRELDIEPFYPSLQPSSLLSIGMIVSAIFFQLIAMDCLIQKDADDEANPK
jgi:hypothetical protein